jgi:virulence-associated protein VagC
VSKTFPKEREQKLKETIKDLRADNRALKKRVKILEDELKHILKPVRKRKAHKNQVKLTSDEWRDNFIRDLKDDLKKKKEGK